MAINPDDLLIFEARKAGLKPQVKKKEEAEVQPQAQARPQAQPQAQVQPQVQKKVETTQTTTEKQYAEAKAQMPKAREAEQMAPNAEAPASEFVVAPPSEEEIEESLEMVSDRTTTEMLLGKKKKITKSEEEEKEAAIGMYCVWHPWRPAYAICAYCHRPFCYEDLTEYNGHYYCLEDINKVSANAPSENVYVKYNNLGIIAASSMLVVFVIFMYTSLGSIIAMVNLSNHIGILAFSSKFLGTYGYLLFGTILAVLMLVASLLIFLETKRSFPLGLFVSFASVAIFSYEYLNTSNMYAAILSILSFAGLVSLIYSRNLYEGEESEELEIGPESETAYPTNVPNIGRF